MNTHFQSKTRFTLLALSLLISASASGQESIQPDVVVTAIPSDQDLVVFDSDIDHSHGNEITLDWRGVKSDFQYLTVNSADWNSVDDITLAFDHCLEKSWAMHGYRHDGNKLERAASVRSCIEQTDR